MAMPADQRSWNFVCDAVAKHRWMAGTCSYFLTHRVLDFSDALLKIQKSRGALAGQPHHYPQSVPFGRIQKPSRRRGISAHRVNSGSRHLAKVRVHYCDRRKFVSFGISPKGTIGHAANVKLTVAEEKEFTPNPNAQRCLRQKRPNELAFTSQSFARYIYRPKTSRKH